MSFRKLMFSTMCTILLISFFILMIDAAGNITVKTSTNSVSDSLTVVIDPGHGGCVLTMVA